MLSKKDATLPVQTDCSFTGRFIIANAVVGERQGQRAFQGREDRPGTEGRGGRDPEEEGLVQPSVDMRMIIRAMNSSVRTAWRGGRRLENS